MYGGKALVEVIRPGTASPEFFSTTELESAAGQIWNLLNPHAVSETKDQRNVILNDLGGERLSGKLF